MQLANMPNEGLAVNWVADGTPADKAGFEVGDLIVSIDGKNCDTLGGIVGIKKMFRKDPGTTYNLIVNRGGEEHKLKLTLADLFS